MRRTLGLLVFSTLIACSATLSSGGPNERGRPAESASAGRFYASTGVELDSVSVGERELYVAIRNRGDFRFVTEFIGHGGVVLSRTGDNPAIYRLTGSEAYLRVKVTDSGGAVAWLQPIFVTRLADPDG